MADLLVSSGIGGILNFAPVPLSVPPHVSLVPVDLSVQLENLAYKVQKTMGEVSSSCAWVTRSETSAVSCLLRGGVSGARWSRLQQAWEAAVVRVGWGSSPDIRRSGCAASVRGGPSIHSGQVAGSFFRRDTDDDLYQPAFFRLQIRR